MSRIVIATWGSFGDLNPYVAIALELKARGHEPVIATMPFYRDVVEREGIAFRSMRPAIDPTDADVVRRAMHPVRGPEVLVRDVLLSAIEGSYEDLSEAVAGADLLVSHPIAYAAPIVADRTGVPWVSSVLAPLGFFSRHDAPVLPAAPWLKRAERFGSWVGPAVLSLMRSASRGWSAPVYQLRARLGLPTGGDPLFDAHRSPRLVLALFSRALAKPQPDWAPRVCVTGYPVWDGAHGATLSPRLSDFLDRGPPPVVFTLGSTMVHAAGNFYAESAAAARRIGRRAVLLAGAAGGGRLTGMVGEDAIVVDAAPHSLLFPRAAVVVQQCGAGTLGQALRAGRPILAVPFAHDQPDNAYRVARLGVARTVYPRRYRGRRAADELRRLLDEPSYARRAEEVAAVVRSEGGARSACDAIEAELRNG